MALQLLPLAAIGLGGAFLGSQADDAIEESFKTPHYGEPSLLPRTGTILKLGILAGAFYLAFKGFKK